MDNATMTPEKAQALLDGATPGPWLYRPHKFDDWGVVRGGPLNEEWGGYPHLAQVRDPAKLDDDTLCQHRAKGDDPWEGNARLTAAAPDLARAYIAQAAELTRLRAQVDLLQGIVARRLTPAEKKAIQTLSTEGIHRWEAVTRKAHDGLRGDGLIMMDGGISSGMGNGDATAHWTFVLTDLGEGICAALTTPEKVPE